MTLIDAISGKLARARNAHWPQYIFIHINKTAGSSIERALRLRFEHRTAEQKREQLGEYRWNRAFKFSFVRNPWDKVVSHYHYRVKTNRTGLRTNSVAFKDWVLAAYGERDARYLDNPLMFAPQSTWLCDPHGRIMVDFIGRFESLPDDVARLGRLLGREFVLPHLKPSDRKDYREYYDAATWQVVAEHFAEDLQLFDYADRGPYINRDGAP